MLRVAIGPRQIRGAWAYAFHTISLAKRHPHSEKVRCSRPGGIGSRRCPGGANGCWRRCSGRSGHWPCRLCICCRRCWSRSPACCCCLMSSPAHGAQDGSAWPGVGAMRWRASTGSRTRSCSTWRISGGWCRWPRLAWLCHWPLSRCPPRCSPGRCRLAGRGCSASPAPGCWQSCCGFSCSPASPGIPLAASGRSTPCRCRRPP